jgi:hypothetical protein
MSAYIEPRFGPVGRVWPIVNEGCQFLFVEEAQGRVQYLVLYRCDDGCWKKIGEYAVGFPSPLALEVDAIHSTIRFVGYPVAGGISPLLVIEEDSHQHWYLLYVLEKGYWVLSKEYQAALAPVDEKEAGDDAGSNVSGNEDHFGL